ncbi:agamous-like MADS-box protein AGL29 [Quillaja saponaria]|uniref:Agamous-like MADS-box protein AGL29 n=1 Tax=Quillaja saponaria TaxID=32244 RepID=A0AAD7KWL1_QUISA|nr:agamous-like MADS-box protein AGL29 [Quillaja saponaria]
MVRRKTVMKTVKDKKSSRQVTISKRRNGVFKNANELAILCSVAIAILCFSPGGKPRFEAVIDNPETFNADGGSSSKKSLCDQVKKLTEKFRDVLKKLETSKKKGEMVDKSMNEVLKRDILKLKGKLEELRDKVKEQINDMEASSSLLLLEKEPVVLMKD